jgi:cytochrome c peroxidase
VTGLAGDTGKFRVPSLRNIAITAPYMHDGRFSTLEEVIDHYDHGMVSVDPNTTALQDPVTGGPRRMNLSEAQKQALEAFLLTLTDEALLADPRFSDPFAQAP